MSTEESRVTTETLSDAKLLGDDFDSGDSKELEEEEHLAMDAEADPWAAMSGSKFREIMESDGPTVDAVVLKSDGTVQAVRYNATPRVQDARRILGSNPTIIGEWADLQVLLVRGRFDGDDENLEAQPQNSHTLRFPFTKESVRGDILLYRVNDSATACDFTADEYNSFAAKASEDEGKVWDGPTEIDGIVEEDEDDYEDDFEGEEMNGDLIGAMLDQIVNRQFNEKFGRDPSEEELESFKSVIAAKMGFGGAPVGLLGALDEMAAEDDDDDSEYIPDDEDVQRAELEDAEDDAALSADEDAKVDGLSTTAEADDEENEDLVDEDDNFAEQYAEAIEAVRQLGRVDGSKMLARIAQQFEENDGADVSDETLSAALGDARDRFAAGDDEETDAVDLDEDSFIDTTPISAADAALVAVEMKEALDVVRGVARADAQLLADKIANTFEEINGRQPNLDELRSIFSRIEDSFADEASDELVDDIAARIAELPLAGEENIELTDAEKTVIIAVAKSAVTQEMANQAVEYFVQLTGRQPNSREFNDLLLSIATTRFVENHVAEEDDSENDSDYDPTEDAEQMRRDREIDDEEDAREETAGSSASVDKENFEKEVSHLIQASEEINGPRPATAPGKPVAFYSPVVTPGTKRKSRIASMKEAETSLDAKLFARAVENFQNRYEREPNEDEVATLRKFFGQTDRFVHTAPIDFDIDSDSADLEDVIAE